MQHIKLKEKACHAELTFLVVVYYNVELFHNILEELLLFKFKIHSVEQSCV